MSRHLTRVSLVCRRCLLWMWVSVVAGGCAGPKQTTTAPTLVVPRFSATSPVHSNHTSWIGFYEGKTDLHEDGDFALNIEYVHPHVVVTGWVQHGDRVLGLSEGTGETSFSFATLAQDPLKISGNFPGYGPQSNYERVECSLSRAGDIINGSVRAFKTRDPEDPLLPEVDFTFEVMLSHAEPRSFDSR